MKILTIPGGSLFTNCYMAWNEDQENCILIDPGFQADLILDQVRSRGKKVEAILLTHGHFDHVGAVKDLAADTDCRVFLCAEDTQLPPMFTAGKLYFTDTYGEGSILNIAGLYIHVLHTPGHTPGSVCLLADDALFSGDTLFAGSCGRTDIGGNSTVIQKSLKRLASMEVDFRVFPGHGESTTLAAEKRYNPYMK